MLKWTMTRDDTKLLQAIISGQKALEERLSEKIDGVKVEVQDVKKEVKKNGDRLDKLGAQLAYLEDDVPTIKEFNKLDKRVAKLESIVYKRSLQT